ncbi:TadE/TadG family type IV pilus assembly protein [Rhizorhapis sp. SPR117]|uniref:TadE/TadG family type IV pilus assembly protein n=1 Tax=Rhizorhapis sp. SPR117 TaxID=2912611 RepID=UPI001F1ECCB7|nr:pilus assembly protein [Rhizorhapis sp. SPR117]
MCQRFAKDQSGITATEFGLIAPVFILLLMGTLDMGHTLYMQSVLQGVVQKTARDATLESSSEAAKQAELDAMVTNNVLNLAKNATVTISRRYFKDFTKAAQSVAEPFTDTNGNGICDAGEPYQDNNNNSSWDKDGGDAGQGGAKDAVLYTADVSYPRLFPMHGLMGLPATAEVQATTVLANQPYGDQAQYGAATLRNCA